MIWAGYEAGVKNIHAYKNMVEKTEGKVPIGKCIYKYENNFKIGIKKIRLENLVRPHIFPETLQREDCLSTVLYIFTQSSVFLGYNDVHSGAI
jgi:hypothetical protein